MKKLKCAILEDDRIAQKALKIMSENMGFEVAGVFTSSDDLIATIDPQSLDFAVLDIRVQGGKTGIEVAKWLNENALIPVVFTTGFPDEENNLPSNFPFHILIKPIAETDLKNAIEFMCGMDRGLYHTKNSKIYFGDNTLLLSTKGSNNFLKVDVSEIIRIQGSDDHFLRIYTTLREDPYQVNGTLKEFMELVKARKLFTMVRCHNSHIINVKYIKEFVFNQGVKIQRLVRGVFNNNDFVELGARKERYNKNVIVTCYLRDQTISVTSKYSQSVFKAILEYG